MYTIEKDLLHLKLGDQPSRDFCTSCREEVSRQLVQIFSNELHQKLIKMPYKMRRVAAAAAAIPTAGAHLI